jgi:hypothetical protein
VRSGSADNRSRTRELTLDSRELPAKGAFMESTQVRLRIVSPDKEFPNLETGITVTGKDILKQMKTNNVWKIDHIGKYAGLMFDGQTFNFREGEITTVPATVANHLRRASAIIVGSDKLNGPIVPFIEVVETFDMTEPQKAVRTPTTCPICGEDQKTFPALTRHLGQERKKHPELFQEEKGKTDWEGSQGGTLDEVEE